MSSIEGSLARLDGVISVSAGWLSNQASIVTRPGRALTLEEVDAAVDRPFRCQALEKQ